MSDNIYSSLKLEGIIFDKILFERFGISSNSDTDMGIEINLGKNDDNVYRVSLVFKGGKSDDYVIEVQVSGFFRFTEDLSDEEKDKLLEVNAVAIIFPYLRSQVSSITAQQGVDPILLPVINFSKM